MCLREAHKGKLSAGHKETAALPHQTARAEICGERRTERIKKHKLSSDKIEKWPEKGAQASQMPALSVLTPTASLTEPLQLSENESIAIWEIQN